MIHRYILLAVFLVLGVMAGTFANLPTLLAGNTMPEVVDDSPSDIKFSHKMHIKDIGLDCATCHPGAATSKRVDDKLSSTHEQCTTCHEDQLTNDCAFCHSNPADIVPRTSADRALLFSHQQHLGMKDVECSTCHKGMEEVTLSGTLSFPEMATCNTCHNDRKATNTCEACHTDFATLIPADHKRSDFLRAHRDETRLGTLQTSCQTCHTETFCQQCHQGAGLKTFRQRHAMVEPRPKASTKDSQKRTILQNVHELNYRFTHGIDARSKQSECSSCHSTETFCAMCHGAGGNITQGTFKPKSHTTPGFTTLGRGTGGGLHAEEARRDIESCMSCHNLEGQDPSCMTCHSESGRVR